MSNAYERPVARRAWGHPFPEVPECPICERKGYHRPVELDEAGEPTARCAVHARFERDVRAALREAAAQPGWSPQRAKQIRDEVALRYRR